MLRRPATTIKLSPEDILEYDESLKQQQQQQQQEQQQQQDTQEHNQLKQTINDQFSPQLILQEQIGGPSTSGIINSTYKQQQQQLPPSSIQGQSRDERIGISKN